MKPRSFVVLFACAFLFCSLFSFSAFADSQARIVRLSSVEGSVQIDRGDGGGYEKAFLNMPITEGVRLWTAKEGRAEVEFENGSTIHMAPGTILEFTALSLRSSGNKMSSVDVQQGKAYFNFTGHKDDEFAVTFRHEKVNFTREAHFRVDLSDAKAALAVFKGGVTVEGPSGSVEVGKKETATFDLDENDQYQLAKNIEEDPFDAWDKEQSAYHERYSASNSHNSPYRYGFSDLNYYGNYSNIPGCGLCWQPFFTGIGWDPFMDGAWMWYPGFGYTWVSAYPWGWTPYHNGQWFFAPGFGWAWQPGTSWVAWNRLPPVINPPVRYVPPRPPVITTHTTVAVGRGPTAPAGLAPGTKLVVKGADAGLSVPRGLHNLGRLNNDFRAKGAAMVQVPSAGRVVTAGPSAGVSTPNVSGRTGSAATSGPRSAPVHTPSPHVSPGGGFSGGRTSAPSHASAPSHSSSPHK